MGWALALLTTSGCGLIGVTPIDAGRTDVTNPYLTAPPFDPDPDVVWPALPDASANVADGDGGVCDEPDPNPLDYYFYPINTIYFARYDFQAIGLGADSPYVIAQIKDPSYYSTPMPMDQAEGCTFFAAGRNGNDTWNNAPSLNLGDINFSAAGQVLRLYYDTGLQQYVADTARVTSLPGGLNYQIDIMGGPAAPATSASAPMPPLWPSSMTHFPPAISRETDSANVFTWDLPDGTPPHSIVSFYIFDLTRANVVHCVAPACRHQLTVPATLLRHYAPNEMVALNAALVQHVAIQAGTLPLNVFMIQARVYAVNVP